MMGAVTMKITSSTSITSTSGVTLIWDIDGPDDRPAPSKAIPHLLRALLQEMTLGDVQELRREVLHVGVENPDLVIEMVVADDGRDRRREPDRGRDERLRDSRRDRLDARRLRLGEPAERVHDPPDRAEEADERRRRRGRGEEGERLLEPRHLLVRRAPHRPLDVGGPAELGLALALTAPPAAGEAEQFLIAGAEHLGDRALLVVEARRVDLAEALRLPEDLDEALGLLSRAPELAQLEEGDPPAPRRARHQDPQDRDDDGTGPRKEVLEDR